MKPVLTCLKLCLSLYYDAGFPIEGAPSKCFCADIVLKSTLPPLPLTSHYIPNTEKKPEPAREDDRAKVQYDE